MDWYFYVLFILVYAVTGTFWHYSLKNWKEKAELMSESRQHWFDQYNESRQYIIKLEEKYNNLLWEYNNLKRGKND